MSAAAVPPDVSPAVVPTGASPAVLVRGVRKTFPGEQALRGVDLEVEPGEIHALIGLNGAGKSTLLRSLVGMLRPEAGSIRVLGAPILTAPAGVRARVGHMIESAPYPDLTVRENLASAARLHGVADPARLSERAGAVIDALELGHWAERRAGALSTGNRGRLAVGCAVVHEPDLLILDEPTAALDPLGVVLVRAVLADARARGGAVLVSSHHLDEVSRIADRITVIHRGKIVGTLPPGGHGLEQAFFHMVLAVDTATADPKTSSTLDTAFPEARGAVDTASDGAAQVKVTAQASPGAPSADGTTSRSTPSVVETQTRTLDDPTTGSAGGDRA